MRDANHSIAYQSTGQLIPGAYPVECAGGATCTIDKLISTATSNTENLTEHELVLVMKGLEGHTALFILDPSAYKTMVDAIAQGNLSTDTPDTTLGVPPIWY